MVRLNFTIPTSDIDLWWPNGYGEQMLYRLKLKYADDTENNFCENETCCTIQYGLVKLRKRITEDNAKHNALELFS